MKNIFLSAMLGLTAGLTMLAVPAKPGLHTVRQADGTEITLRLVGDERFHTLVTTDGLPVMRSDDGSITYADPATGAASRIVAHNPGSRTELEAEFLKANASELSVSLLAKKRLAIRKAAGKTAPAKASSQVPNIGSARIPILLVQYSDVKFRDGDNAAETFKDFFVSGETSARQYFIDQSNGKYTPEFDVYGPFTLSKTRATYGGNDSWGNDKGVGQMVGEACRGLNATVNFQDYDNDGDGECDVVIVLYAGVGEASSGVENSVWPAQWNLASSDYGRYLTLDGVKVDKFAVFNELNGTTPSKIDGVGTFCHEFSHCLGLPDFYDTQYSGHFGMACWSLMDQGSYNNDGYTPIGYSAYEKDFMGWIKIPEAEENTRYSLTPLNQKREATDMAVKISSKNDPNEYFILENRAKQGWDKYMPAEGLLISHVSYSATAWDNNCVNDYDLQRMTPIPADNSLKMNRVTYYGQSYYEVDEKSLLGDLWPYGTANELTDTSVPAARLSSGGLMGKPVTEITSNDDGTVSFWFMKAPVPAMVAPELNPASAITSTGFTASWEHTPDAAGTTYTLEVKPHSDLNYEKVLEADFTGASNPWEAEPYYSLNDEGLRLGSSSNTGAVVSPEFTAREDGIVTVAVTARDWNADGSSVVISIIGPNGSEVSTQTVAVTSEYATYSVVLDAIPMEKNTVRLATAGVKKRIYISQAVIYNGDATEAEAGSADAAATGVDEPARTFTGITSLTHTVTDLTENGVYDFRVKAVPSDATQWLESPWSETLTVTLGGSGAIDNAFANDAEATAEYFTLEGIRVSADTLSPGIYICRRGTSVSKILVK